ncbi:MAG: hypothetical protein ACREM1_05535 [Longimicrobiales bacterium]
MYLLAELRIELIGPPLSAAEWAAVGIIVIIAAHVVLLIHELGHVLGGWLAGYRFRELIVGLVTVERRGDRLRVGLNRRLRHYGGRVLMLPGRAQESKGRTVLLLVLGPVTSLAAGSVVTLAGLAWLSGAAVATVDLGEILLTRQIAVIGVGSVVVGLANLVPVSFHGRKSDGAKLWERLRGLHG